MAKTLSQFKSSLNVRVTTVIPAYNAAEYVVHAVESALAQENISQQILVIDDGSTDDTTSVLRAFGDQIETIQQTNRGLSVARNRGIQAAHGEFIAFLDADDVWCPGKLSRQVAALQQAPEAIMVHSRTVSWDPHSGREAEFVKARSEEYHGDCFAKLYQSNAICVSSVMARTKDVRQLGGFDEGIHRPTTQDYDLWLRIAFRSPVLFVEEKGTLYRRHAGNASLQSRMMLEDQIHVIEKTLTYGGNRLCRELGRRATLLRLANLYFELGYLHYEQGDIGSAQKCFRASFRRGRLDPHNWLFAFLPFRLLTYAARRHRAKLSA